MTLESINRPRKQTPSSAVALVAGAVALSLFGDAALYAILPIHFEQLGLSPFHVGLILSLNRFIRIITNHYAKHLLEKKYAAGITVSAFAVGSLITAMYALTPRLFVFLVLRALWGFCWSIIRHAGVMTAVRQGQGKKIGHILGVYQGLVGLGFIAGTFFGPLLYDVFDFQTAFLYLAGLSFAAVPLGIAAGRRSTGYSIHTDSSIPRNKRVVGALLTRGFIISAGGVGLVMSTLGYVLKTQFGGNIAIGSVTLGIATVTGILLGARYAVDTLGAPLLGWVVDRAGVASVSFFGFLFGAGSLAVMAIMDAPIILVPSLIVFFMLSSAARLAMTAEAGGLGGNVYARYITVADVGAAVGPLLGWLGIDLSSDYTVTFLIGAALFVLAALSVPFGKYRSVKASKP